MAAFGEEAGAGVTARSEVCPGAVRLEARVQRAPRVESPKAFEAILPVVQSQYAMYCENKCELRGVVLPFVVVRVMEIRIWVFAIIGKAQRRWHSAYTKSRISKIIASRWNTLYRQNFSTSSSILRPAKPAVHLNARYRVGGISHVVLRTGIIYMYVLCFYMLKHML